MPSPAAQPALPDELLEEIFLRLHEAADLARASAACASFHRIVSDRRFLRRFRSIHPPPVLGFLDVCGSNIEFCSAQRPRRSASAARALAQAADFTFSFLPMDSNNPNCWQVRDARNGRVLLSRRAATSSVLEDLVVCDPMHRRYVQIPSIPADLAASTNYGGVLQMFDPFLAPAGEDEEESSLRVICNVVSKTNIVSFVFSSVTGNWRSIPSSSIASYEWMNILPSLDRHCAGSCFGWTDFGHKVMLVLDTRLMEFSIVNLLPESQWREKAIVQAGEGRLGLVVNDYCKFDIYSKNWGDNGVGTEEWRHDMVIQLPLLPDCYWHIFGPDGGCLLLWGIPRDQRNLWSQCRKSSTKKPDKHYFVLELKTLRVERLCTLKLESNPGYLYSYSSFPSPLSPPSI
ncbi:hypothetical protein ACP70R_033324 [Stipagrostis hirtigluma subsp. patula]